MKKLFHIIPMLAVFAASCSKEPATAPVQHAVSDEIVFTADGEFAAEVTTKATSAVTSLTSFNVNAVKGTLGSAETNVFNVAFTKDGATANYKGNKYWPAADPSYRFYASNVTMAPAATGPTVAATNATDVVCAVLASPTYKQSNELSFNHIFARVGSCNITAPAGATITGLTVQITPKTGGTYNLYTGNGKTDGTGWSGTSTGSATTIATGCGQTADNGLYLVPGSYTLTVKYHAQQGDYEDDFTKTATVSLVGGKVNNIKATLPSPPAQQIVFTVSVAAWGTNDITATIS